MKPAAWPLPGKRGSNTMMIAIYRNDAKGNLREHLTPAEGPRDRALCGVSLSGVQTQAAAGNRPCRTCQRLLVRRAHLADRDAIRLREAAADTDAAMGAGMALVTRLDAAAKAAPACPYCAAKAAGQSPGAYLHATDCAVRAEIAAQADGSSDPTEAERRVRVAELNGAAAQRAETERLYGKVWDTAELQAEYQVTGFMAPYVVVRRLSDGKEGSLEFQHSPRLYFNWSPSGRE